MRAFNTYRARLQEEMDLTPSAAMFRLVSEVRDGQPARPADAY
jgi:hypothetical protein